MNLVTAFESSVRAHRQKTATYWGEREFSYEELWHHSQKVAEQLIHQLGVRPGDRVGLWLKNCPEFIPSLFGILSAQGVAVPINNFLKPPEVGFILNDAGADVLITDAELGAHSAALAAARPGLKTFQVALGAPASSPASSAFLGDSKSDTPRFLDQSLFSRATPEGSFGTSAVGRDAASGLLAALIYTSGTTGRPKGAMLSHGNLLHNIESCRIVLQAVDADRFAVLLPMFHSYMLTVGVMLPLLIGGSIVLVKSVHPVRSAVQEVFQRQATILPAIPQFYRSLVHVSTDGPLPLRICISGAAPLPLQVLNEFEAKFHIPLIEGYGLSEASPVVAKNPLNGTRKAGSIGLPIPAVEISIQNDAGQELGPNQIGELCVRGGNVMQGYWKQPEETAKVMRKGWLLTGDIGYRDDEGYYFITDRKKDMLLVNGINVYPREIEEVLYQFPGVKEAAVIGQPDARKGEQPIAFVSANEGTTLVEKAMQQFVRDKLADYKVPRKVIVVAALPRNAAGKILKTTLREMA